MATKSQEILLKGNTTNASAVPSSLKVREIAINALDRSLFTNDGNSIVKLYTGTNKWFDVNGNANNALKLGGILASEYINKETFNSHINNSVIHITANERTAWNAKWDYNEETIKAVKVNAAVNADKLATARKIWGRPFDGSGDVSGDLINVGNITASGKATIQGDIVCGGEVVAVAGEGTPAGVTDYSALTGKPAINGVTLVSGNNTLAALGIQAAGDYATNSGVTTLLSEYATKTFISNNYAGKAAFNSHTGNTDIHITSEERTAWNAKWDYDEATIKAVKVTSASSADSVAWSGISGKPTTFTPSAHTHTASEVSGLPTSLKNPYALTFGSKTYDGSAAATITASDLGALTAHQSIYALTLQVNSVSQGTYNPASAAKTINIAVPTKTSDITNDSGFITSASIPTALKNPYAVEIKANGVSLGTYDGSAAAIFNLSADNVGAARKVHSHYSIVTEGDNRDVATTPDDYYDSLVFKGLKSNNTIGSPSSVTYSYLIGLRGWSDSSGGDTHELAFNNSGIFRRQGSTEWGSWYKLIDTGNFTKSLIEGVLTGDITSHTHSYLPLSGGTISGILTIKANGYPLIEFKAGDTTYGYYGFSETGVAAIWDTKNWHTLIHAGNYNSYSPTLTGTGASGTWGISISGNAATATNATSAGNVLFDNTVTRLSSGQNLDNYTKGLYGYSNADNPTNSYGNNTAVFAFQSERGVDTWQITFDGNGIQSTDGPAFAIRGNYANQGWTGWYPIAKISSNVASATKLQTPRSIWGQPFDGMKDVSGTAYFPNGDLIHAKDERGAYIYVMGFTSVLGIGYGSASAGIDTYIDGNNVHLRYSTSHIKGLTLNSYGNVLIGTTTDNGYKLQVQGAVYVSGSSSDVGGYAYYWGIDRQYFLGSNSNTDYYLWATTASHLRIGTSDTERVRITSGGNVLIGTSTDNGYKLQVNGSERVYGDLIVDGEVSTLVA